jgi:hypothetical protein
MGAPGPAVAARRLRAACLLVLLVLALWPPAASAGPADTGFTVQVEGLAAVEGNNAAAARERAVADALQRAVERAAATLLPPETIAQQDALLRQRVYPETARFVETYRIIAESPSATLYQASVEAVIAREPLRQALVKLGLVAGPAAGPLGVVSVTARGATRHAQLASLLGSLQQQGQAQRVRYRSLAPGVVTLEVETPLAPAALAEEISRVSVEGARISVASPDGRRLEVVFTPAR